MLPAGRIGDRLREEQTVMLSSSVLLAAGGGSGIALVGAGIGIGLAVLGAALGIAKLAAAALESTARQPEMAGNLRTTMIIPAALIEGFTFFALVIFLMALLGGGGDAGKDKSEASPDKNAPAVSTDAAKR
jgi:F-type H+-transporting ATPase subunit c